MILQQTERMHAFCIILIDLLYVERSQGIDIFLFVRRIGKIKLKLPHFHVAGTCVSIQPALPLQQQLALLLPGS